MTGEKGELLSYPIREATSLRLERPYKHGSPVWVLREVGS